jgi:ADP-ribose pyrophosphatase YjhB (NUDIX family)
VRAVIEHDGRYLLIRNEVSKDFWCLPGGIGIVVGNLLYVHQI